MKKILFMAVAISLLLVGCGDANKKNEKKNIVASSTESKVDSLQKIIDQKNNEIDDIMATVNEIEESLRMIAEAENELTILRDGEGGANMQEQIKINLKSISEKMTRNRELIAKLEKQLRESSIQADQLKLTITNLTNQITTKENELKTLRAELNAKNVHIAELDQAVNELNTNVEKLTAESEEKSKTISENNQTIASQDLAISEKNQTISENNKTISENNQTIASQDKQLNTAWYVFGTKKELQDQHIVEKDKVLQSNFNKGYFTKVDIRVDKEIKLYSKWAKLLTNHPATSYTLRQDANKQYILRITNPDAFWSTSKYLVILVK